ncbi:MAG: hydrogenase-4 component G [Desulfobacterales bacterium]|nr:hydrogenase-4 component G [Desulfobacterales bacterium]
MDISKIQTYSSVMNLKKAQNSNKNYQLESKGTEAKNKLETQVAEFKRTLQVQMLNNVKEQAGVSQITGLTESQYNLISDIEYNGKPLTELSQPEALELVSEDGYFGINKTSDRIADFVIKGAGDDLNQLKAGREGIIKGFKEAEKLWGGKLPDISYKTFEKSLEKIDKQISQVSGTTGAVMDIAV